MIWPVKRILSQDSLRKPRSWRRKDRKLGEFLARMRIRQRFEKRRRKLKKEKSCFKRILEYFSSPSLSRSSSRSIDRTIAGKNPQKNRSKSRKKGKTRFESFFFLCFPSPRIDNSRDKNLGLKKLEKNKKKKPNSRCIYRVSQAFFSTGNSSYFFFQ